MCSPIWTPNPIERDRTRVALSVAKPVAPSDRRAGAILRRALLVTTLAFSFSDAGAQITPPRKIAFETGGFTGQLDDEDNFGYSIASMGDIDGDGVQDLAVGAPGDDDGGPRRGAAWVLFMNTDGTVKTQQKLSVTEGGFVDSYDDYRFGVAISNGTDLDGDGQNEILMGGNVTVQTLFLNQDGTIRRQALTFTGITLAAQLTDYFATIGDLDDDGQVELLAAAPGGPFTALFTLHPDGSTTAFIKLNKPATDSKTPMGPP